MIKGDILLVDLVFEFKIWKRRLEHYVFVFQLLSERNEELRVLKERRELLPDQLDLLMAVRRKNELLLNRIKVQEQELRFYNKDFPITQSHQYYGEHLQLREQMRCLKREYEAMMAAVMDDLIF